MYDFLCMRVSSLSLNSDADYNAQVLYEMREFTAINIV